MPVEPIERPKTLAEQEDEGLARLREQRAARLAAMTPEQRARAEERTRKALEADARLTSAPGYIKPAGEYQRHSLAARREQQGTTSRGGRPKRLWLVHPREVLRRYDECDATLSELARECDVSVTVVRKRLYRAGYVMLPQLVDEDTDERRETLQIDGWSTITAEELSRLCPGESMVLRREVHAFLAEHGMHPAMLDSIIELIGGWRRAGVKALDPLPTVDETEGSAPPERYARKRRRRPRGPSRIAGRISIDEMVRRYTEDGDSLEIIAQASQLSPSSVRNRLLAEGVEMRGRGARGHAVDMR